jgi:uncharacterized protein with PhoU and TrkA domain
VVELAVQPEDWLCRRSLADLDLPSEGVLVLGIERRGGDYVGAPRGAMQLTAGDTVLLYGPREVLTNLDQRRQGASGNWEHHKAIDRQRCAAARDQEAPDPEQGAQVPD